MKFTIVCFLFLTALSMTFFADRACAADSFSYSNSHVCKEICSYERLGIPTYVNACLQGCNIYVKAYSHSGSASQSMATCKAGCSATRRNICEYGCNEAQRSIP